jgi:outer membrane protein assembly factor BamB
MRKLHLGLALAALVTMSIGCGGGDELKCSFKQPIKMDESPDQWPKFRRDAPNTGTIRLSAAAYAAVASTAPRTMIWQFPPSSQPAKGAFVASPSISPGKGIDRRLYIGSTDTNLYVMRTNDGSPVTTLVGEGIVFTAFQAITSTALVGTLADVGVIVFGTGDAQIAAIDEQGIYLEDIWPFIAGAFISSSPGINVLNGLIITGTLGGGLVGICPNGVGYFGIAAGSTESSPAFGRSSNPGLDGTSYIGSSDRLLRAVGPAGALLWSFSMSAPIFSSPVVELSPGGDETEAIYVVDSSGLISKVDATGSGTRFANFAPPRIGATRSSPALAEHRLAGKRLYIGSDDGHLYALDAVSGAPAWPAAFATGGPVRSSPAVVLDEEAVSDPIIVVGSGDGTLYFIRDTGNEPMLLASFAVPEGASRGIESSPAVNFDGTVYFGSNNGRVYAVR